MYNRGYQPPMRKDPNNPLNQLKEREEFEHYRKIKLLGEGSFGKAYLIERISDGLMCVMKTIDLSRMSEGERRETL